MDSIKESLAGFDELWKRVAGKEPAQTPPEPRPTPPENSPPPFSEDETLKRFIQDEAQAAAYYSALARMFQGGGRTGLLGHAADCRRRIRRLRAEYFIRTGVTYTPPADSKAIAGKLAALRTALVLAEKAAENYTLAAERTSSEELRRLYQSFAADAARRAGENRALLVDSFS